MTTFIRNTGLMMTAAFFALAVAAPALAQTVTVRETVVQSDVPNAEKVDFQALDLNRDGILSRREVGTRLFYAYDTDGNEVIDNIEFTKPRVLTLVPFEKTQLTMIDFDDDGIIDRTIETSDSFYRRSMIGRFDDDQNGLSPREFLAGSFLMTDTNESGAIELAEWQDAYAESVTPLAAKQYRYNQ